VLIDTVQNLVIYNNKLQMKQVCKYISECMKWIAFVKQ